MICPNCGAEYSENDKFCTSCGTQFSFNETTEAPAAAPVGNTENQQKVLDNLYRFLKYRRVACIITGIYLLVCSLILALCGAICIISGAVLLFEDTFGVFSLSYGIMYFLMGILYLPIPFINFAMASKANKYMNELYFNVRPAADYSSSIGRLVLCYFFNEVALVFAIIGCVYARKNSDVIAEIEHNQALNK